MSTAFVTGTGGLPLIQSVEMAKNAECHPESLLVGDRFRMLDYRQSFFDCTQHDWKEYDFDGRMLARSVGAGASPTMTMPGAECPLAHRRPSKPYRLAPTITKSFTSFVFGEDRFPRLTVAGDDKTDDFTKAISVAGRLPWHMLRARNIGGSVGTVGLSWCFDSDGRPKFDVHNGKNLHVFEWENRSEKIVRHVAEVYPYWRSMWNGKEYSRVYFWYRRDWTPDMDFVFKDVLYVKGETPIWEIDEDRSTHHDDGVCHLEWIQNQPSEDIDGLPDYHGQYEQLNVLDILSSIVARGGIANLDPTLVLGIDPELAARTNVRKGDGNFMAVGQGGTANYLELAGRSIDAGLKLISSTRLEILEGSQCVIPDPSTIAASGISSVSQKMIYFPTTACAQVLREQYGTPMERMLENMIRVAQSGTTRKTVGVTESGEEVPVQVVVTLPPRFETKEETDDEGNLKKTVKKIEREPGEGGDVELAWPAWFPPTYADQAQHATTMQTATGGKAFLSTETATELTSNVHMVNPEVEKQRMLTQGKKDEDAQAAMFPKGIGGEVDNHDELPPGALSKRMANKPGAPPFPPKPKAPSTAEEPQEGPPKAE